MSELVIDCTPRIRASRDISDQALRNILKYQFGYSPRNISIWHRDGKTNAANHRVPSLQTQTRVRRCVYSTVCLNLGD